MLAAGRSVGLPAGRSVGLPAGRSVGLPADTDQTETNSNSGDSLLNSLSAISRR
jgi:hypothetical protein